MKEGVDAGAGCLPRAEASVYPRLLLLLLLIVREVGRLLKEQCLRVYGAAVELRVVGCLALGAEEPDGMGSGG